MSDLPDRLRTDANVIQKFGEEAHGFINYETIPANAREAATEIERLLAERDELFLENGKIANTIGAENLKLRAALNIIAWNVDGEEPDLSQCMNIANAALE